MKLKYYMRGLGIGIILTTLILTLSNKKLSDQDIIDKATNLGMEMMDEKDSIIKETDSKDTPSDELTQTPEVTQAPEVTQVPEATQAPEVTQVPEATQTPEATQAPEPTKTPEPTQTPEPTKSPDNDEGTVDSITFTINKGMSSGMVADMLMTKGLIQDAQDFNDFIVKQGKASVIRIGQYTLPVGATYKQIIEMITN
ncbi:MAG TPA: hypothetical protein VJ888_05280 [Mobilitalea sp.]|nr:hypothetical protein [Mobilitalea sp.]